MYGYFIFNVVLKVFNKVKREKIIENNLKRFFCVFVFLLFKIIRYVFSIVEEEVVVCCYCV